MHKVVGRSSDLEKRELSFISHKLVFSSLQTKMDFKLVVRYLLGREGVCAPGRPVFLAHTKQKVNNIVGLTALRLAFFMGYE